VRKQLGDHAGALADVDRTLRTAPEDPDAWNMKGNLHLLYGEIDEAIDCFDRAIALNDTLAAAWFNRGIAHHISYQPEPGCRDLRRSAELGSTKATDALTFFCAF
jgi:tetratricopeptide (TPR) repeat protein